jgi:ribosome-binding ATPase YchF (GTP1/OBG family)
MLLQIASRRTELSILHNRSKYWHCPNLRRKARCFIKNNNTKTIIPATITFVDIAGLVKGASKGEGLGNKFLSHIREVSVIAHVVRCFENENIVHVSGQINPIDDIETINMELVLSDLEVAEKMYLNLEKKTKQIKDKDAQDELELLIKIKECLSNNKPIRTLELSDDEQIVMKRMNFLTSKKVIYVANVS